MVSLALTDSQENCENYEWLDKTTHSRTAHDYTYPENFSTLCFERRPVHYLHRARRVVIGEKSIADHSSDLDYATPLVKLPATLTFGLHSLDRIPLEHGRYDLAELLDRLPRLIMNCVRCTHTPH